MQVILIRIFGTLIIAALLFLGGLWKGYHWANTNCSVDNLTAQVKEREREDAIKKDVMLMSLDELDAAIAHWMR